MPSYLALCSSVVLQGVDCRGICGFLNAFYCSRNLCILMNGTQYHDIRCSFSFIVPDAMYCNSLSFSKQGIVYIRGFALNVTIY